MPRPEPHAHDPLSEEALRLRHENRQALLARLSTVQTRIRELEREVGDIQSLVTGLPWDATPASPEVVHQRTFGFFANSLAGGVALPLAIGLVHPLDTIKTSMQAAIQADHSFRRTARDLAWKGFMRGYVPSVLWACPQGAVRLGSYSTCKEAMLQRFDSQPMLCVSCSAVVGDLASSLVKVPRELVTQRMQTGQFSSGFSVVRHALQEEGARGLFRGYLSTCLRDGPFMVLLFCSYEQFKLWRIRLTIAERGPAQVFTPWSGVETVIWGGVSGALAGFLTTPFDVVKTHIMVSGRPLTMRDAARSIGPTGLFAGAGPRSSWWFCVASVFFACFERARVIIQNDADERHGR